MDKAAGNQHLQFTAEIWKSDENSPSQAEEYRVQIVMKDEFPFLDMNMKWTPERKQNFSVFRKFGQQSKYIGKESTHTPSTLRAIPSGVLNRLAKITSRKPSLHSEGADKVYPDNANSLRKAGLAPPDFPTMGDLRKIQDEKLDIENEKEPDANKKKNRNVYFCVAYSRFFSTCIHKVINGLKKNLISLG